MIDTAIIHIADQLNHYLKRVFDLNEDVVAISNILEQDGTIAPNIENKLVLFLINVEKDTTPFRSPKGKTPGLDHAVTSYPPIYLNLYLMVAGHFNGNNYPEALKFLSNTVSFFQRNPVLDHSSTPGMDRRIEKLVLEIENLNIKDLSTLWSAITGKYLPSIIYKVRMVTIDSKDIRLRTQPIEEIDPTIQSQWTGEK
jgi:hypothetical protein